MLLLTLTALAFLDPTKYRKARLQHFQRVPPRGRSIGTLAVPKSKSNKKRLIREKVGVFFRRAEARPLRHPEEALPARGAHLPGWQRTGGLKTESLVGAMTRGSHRQHNVNAG